MIKAVLFDIDGVILDSFDANYEFYNKLMSQFGYEMIPIEEFLSMFHMTMIQSIKHITQSVDEEEILKIYEFGKNLDAPHHLFKTPKNLESVLEDLSKDYLLAIVTSKRNVNIFKSPQMKSVEKYFKIVVGFDDVINHKPHPEPLLLAIDRLGVLPEETVYIGDMPTDLAAAKSAGVKFILYSKDLLPDIDAHTHSFNDIPKIIQEI